MGNALLSGVSGLQVHQQMLDVAGNNLANVNTTAFKSSRVSFSELLGSTLREASQPTSSVGGTNPVQIGSGVQLAAITRDMTQGTPSSTGQPLDMAIDGAGYFVLSNGNGNVFTRAGSFNVDSEYYLIDPSTGYRVQRIGNEGVAEGFQSVNNNDIRIPYDTSLPAKATETISYTGNLTADELSATTASFTSGTQYSVSDSLATETNKFTELDQGSGLAIGDKIHITGTTRTGATTSADFDLFNVDGTSKTLGDLVSEINTLFPGSTATITNGEIRLADKEAGYSHTDIDMSFVSGGSSTFTLPKYFEMTSAGGEASKNTNIEIYDAQGISHTMSATFVKSTTANTWDLVVTSVSGDADIINRRIDGISFMTDGSFAGLTGTSSTIQLAYAQDGGSISKVGVDFGTIGEFDGLAQLGGASTVAPSGQDGYASGSLSSLSVNSDGVLVGVFTNGIRSNIAALEIATFQNAAGLTSIGNNYFTTSANSGDAVMGKANTGGAGSIEGGALEKSNVDMATEFVNLIVAQNGYQANARTIKVATDMVRELTNLIS